MSRLKKYEVLDNSEIIKDIFKESKPIDGTPAELYLNNYGLVWKNNYKDASGKNGFWYVEKIPYLEEIRTNAEYCGALISVIRNNQGKFTGIYCIYLNEDGTLANLAKPVLTIMNNYQGRDRFIRLGSNREDTIICLSVGIIQTLSIKHLIGEDVNYYAAIDPISLQSFEPPDWALGVYIFVANNYDLDQFKCGLNLKVKLQSQPIGKARGTIQIYCPLHHIKYELMNWHDVLEKEPEYFNLSNPII